MKVLIHRARQQVTIHGRKAVTTSCKTHLFSQFGVTLRCFVGYIPPLHFQVVAVVQNTRALLYLPKSLVINFIKRRPPTESVQLCFFSR